MKAISCLLASTVAVGCIVSMGSSNAAETLRQLMNRVEAEGRKAYEVCPFSSLSKDFFSRFSRDPKAQPKAHEILIDSKWKIAVPQDSSPLGKRMAKDLAEFMARTMGIALAEAVLPQAKLEAAPVKTIALLERGGGDEKVPESFTITVRKDQIIVASLLSLREWPSATSGVTKCESKIMYFFASCGFLASVHVLRR